MFYPFKLNGISTFVNWPNLFPFLRVLNFDIFPSEMRRGCLVCVISNSNSFHSFIFKLCIMIVHTLKTCISNFYFYKFNDFFGGREALNLDSFFCKMLRMCMICVICNSKSFHSLICKLSIMIILTVNVCTSFCAHLIIFSILLGLLNLDILFIRNA